MTDSAEGSAPETPVKKASVGPAVPSPMRRAVVVTPRGSPSPPLAPRKSPRSSPSKESSCSFVSARQSPAEGSRPSPSLQSPAADNRLSTATAGNDNRSSNEGSLTSTKVDRQASATRGNHVNRIVAALEREFPPIDNGGGKAKCQKLQGGIGSKKIAAVPDGPGLQHKQPRSLPSSPARNDKDSTSFESFEGNDKDLSYASAPLPRSSSALLPPKKPTSVAVGKVASTPPRSSADTDMKNETISAPGAPTPGSRRPAGAQQPSGSPTPPPKINNTAATVPGQRSPTWKGDGSNPSTPVRGTIESAKVPRSRPSSRNKDLLNRTSSPLPPLSPSPLKPRNSPSPTQTTATMTPKRASGDLAMADEPLTDEQPQKNEQTGSPVGTLRDASSDAKSSDVAVEEDDIDVRPSPTTSPESSPLRGLEMAAPVDPENEPDVSAIVADGDHRVHVSDTSFSVGKVSDPSFETSMEQQPIEMFPDLPKRTRGYRSPSVAGSRAGGASTFSEPSVATDVVSNLTKGAVGQQRASKSRPSSSRRSHSTSNSSPNDRVEGKRRRQTTSSRRDPKRSGKHGARPSYQSSSKRKSEKPVRVRYAEQYYDEDDDSIEELEEEEEESDSSYVDEDDDSMLSNSYQSMDSREDGIVRAFFDFLQKGDDDSVLSADSDTVGPPSPDDRMRYRKQGKKKQRILDGDDHTVDNTVSTEAVMNEQRQRKEATVSKWSVIHEILKSCAFDPFCDNKYYKDQEGKKEQMQEQRAKLAKGEGTGGKDLDILEFDATFFNEMWNEIKVRKENQACGALNLEICGSANDVAADVEEARRADTHSRLLATMFPPGGGSPQAKKKADLILTQCQQKFPVLYQRLIRRLDERGKRKTGQKGSPHSEEKKEEPNDDDTYNTAEDVARPRADLGNNTPQISNKLGSSGPSSAVFDMLMANDVHALRPQNLSIESESSIILKPNQSQVIKVKAEQDGKARRRKSVMKISVSNKDPSTTGTDDRASQTSSNFRSLFSGMSGGAAFENKRASKTKSRPNPASISLHSDEPSQEGVEIESILADLAAQESESTSIDKSLSSTEHCSRKAPEWQSFQNNFVTPGAAPPPVKTNPGFAPRKEAGRIPRELLEQFGGGKWESFPTPPRDTFHSSDRTSTETQVLSEKGDEPTSHKSILPTPTKDTVPHSQRNLDKEESNTQNDSQGKNVTLQTTASTDLTETSDKVIGSSTKRNLSNSLSGDVTQWEVFAAPVSFTPPDTHALAATELSGDSDAIKWQSFRIDDDEKPMMSTSNGDSPSWQKFPTPSKDTFRYGLTGADVPDSLSCAVAQEKIHWDSPVKFAVDRSPKAAVLDRFEPLEIAQTDAPSDFSTKDVLSSVVPLDFLDLASTSGGGATGESPQKEALSELRRVSTWTKGDLSLSLHDGPPLKKLPAPPKDTSPIFRKKGRRASVDIELGAFENLMEVSVVKEAAWVFPNSPIPTEDSKTSILLESHVPGEPLVASFAADIPPASGKYDPTWDSFASSTTNNIDVEGTSIPDTARPIAHARKDTSSMLARCKQKQWEAFNPMNFDESAWAAPLYAQSDPWFCTEDSAHNSKTSDVISGEKEVGVSSDFSPTSIMIGERRPQADLVPEKLNFDGEADDEEPLVLTETMAEI